MPGKIKSTLVLLPGYDGGGIGTFAQLNQLLSKQVNCLIINYPYFGQSGKAYSSTELISYVHKIIRERKLHRFHLAGFSMGGISSLYAMKYPDQIRSLTLISSSVQPSLSTTNMYLIKVAYYLFKIPLLAQIFSRIYCSPTLSNVVSKLPLPPLQGSFSADLAYPIFGTLANVLYASINSSPTPRLAQSKLPKRAILFADDHSFPAAVYAPILKKLGFHVQVNQHGGHATGHDYWPQVVPTLHQLFT